jgi:hypothetical protein
MGEGFDDEMDEKADGQADEDLGLELNDREEGILDTATISIDPMGTMRPPEVDRFTFIRNYIAVLQQQPQSARNEERFHNKIPPHSASPHSASSPPNCPCLICKFDPTKHDNTVTQILYLGLHVASASRDNTQLHKRLVP